MEMVGQRHGRMVLRESRVGWMQACSIRQSAGLSSIQALVMVKTLMVRIEQAVMFPVLLKSVGVVCIVDYVATDGSAWWATGRWRFFILDQTAEVVSM